jgi:hypothetical protein
MALKMVNPDQINAGDVLANLGRVQTVITNGVFTEITVKVLDYSALTGRGYHADVTRLHHASEEMVVVT